LNGFGPAAGTITGIRREIMQARNLSPLLDREHRIADKLSPWCSPAYCIRGRVLSPLQAPGQIMNKNGFDDALMAAESFDQKLNPLG
jgi:hypothetical protein